MRRLRAASIVAILLLAAGVPSSLYLGWPELSPVQATRWETARTYGLRALATMEVLDQQQLDDLMVVTVSVDNARIANGPRPTAIVRSLVPDGLRWQLKGGGAIGTIAALDGNDAVSCAWTWLRLPTREGEQPLAGFYCIKRDDRVAAIEIDRVEGGVQRVDVTTRRVALFPYAWPWNAKWPAQLPRAIRLYDHSGVLLALPTSPTAPGVGAA
jgi:hypothetical protein